MSDLSYFEKYTALCKEVEKTVNALEFDIKMLQTENNALRKDALRYLCLRDCISPVPTLHGGARDTGAYEMVFQITEIIPSCGSPLNENIDGCIDELIKERAEWSM